MKKKWVKIVAILMVAGLTAVGSVVYAESDGNNPGNNPGNDPGNDPGNNLGHGKGPQAEADERFMEMLNLNGEQRERLAELAESDMAVAEKIKKKREELDAMVAESGTTRSDPDFLIDDIIELEAKALSYKMDRIFALKKIATPEQFEKMQKKNEGPVNSQPGGPGGQNPRGPGKQNPGTDQNPDPDQN